MTGLPTTTDTPRSSTKASIAQKLGRCWIRYDVNKEAIQVSHPLTLLDLFKAQISD